MSCCGKKITETPPAPKPAPQKKSRVSKIKDIAIGNWHAVLRQLKQIPDEKCGHYHARLGICRACEYHTWLTWRDFYRYINDNGGLLKFVNEITSLENWPLLPKQEPASQRKLFCRVCKCFLMGKAACDDEACPLEKWKKRVKESHHD